jgi:hypothetical protein
MALVTLQVYSECCGMKGNSEREYGKDIHTAFVALCLAFMRHRTSLVVLTSDPTLLLKIVSQGGGIAQDAERVRRQMGVAVVVLLLLLLLLVVVAVVAAVLLLL